MTSPKIARRSPSSWRLQAPPRLRPRRSPKTTAGRRIVLALGGNVGDKVASLRRALGALASEGEIELAAVSRFYRTAPWGKTDQDWFVNACALGRTRLEPEALLDRVKALEVELGRAPAERWGPRVIDIDLIAYGDVTLKTERLTLPHPELFNRAFVLVPAGRNRARSDDRRGEGRRGRRAAPGRGRGGLSARLSGEKRVFALASAAGTQLNSR